MFHFSLPPLVRSLALLGLFVGAFALMIVTAPYGRDQPWVAMLLFCGVLGLLKLMSAFEQPRG